MKSLILLLFSLLLLIATASNASSETPDSEVSVMTLNVYGWKTMPEHSNDYADLIKANSIDVVGIQEGVEDWQLTTKLPTDYSRAIALNTALGKCWAHKFQIFINQCAGVEIVESGRFDLTDGTNATRTGEFAVIEKLNEKYLVVNVHWDHESEVTRLANANETANLINSIAQYPTILLGDFNSQCNGKEASIVTAKTDMTLLKSAGIDCIFTKGLVGSGKQIIASPSDHPSVIAQLKPRL